MLLILLVWGMCRILLCWGVWGGGGRLWIVLGKVSYFIGYGIGNVPAKPPPPIIAILGFWRDVVITKIWSRIVSLICGCIVVLR